MRQQLWIQGNKGEGCHSNRGQGEPLLLLLTRVPLSREGCGDTPRPPRSSQRWGRQGLAPALSSFANHMPYSSSGRLPSPQCSSSCQFDVSRVDLFLWNHFLIAAAPFSPRRSPCTEKTQHPVSETQYPASMYQATSVSPCRTVV